MMKRCSMHARYFPTESPLVDVSQFGIHRNQPDGLQSLCNGCKKHNNVTHHEKSNPAMGWKWKRERAIAAEEDRPSYHHIKGNKWSDVGNPPELNARLEKEWQEYLAVKGMPPSAPSKKVTNAEREWWASVQRSVDLSDRCRPSGSILKPRKTAGPKVFKSENEFIALCVQNGKRCFFCEAIYGTWINLGGLAEPISPVQMHALKPRHAGGLAEDVFNGCRFCNTNQNGGQGYASIAEARIASNLLWKELFDAGAYVFEMPPAPIGV